MPPRTTEYKEVNLKDKKPEVSESFKPKSLSGKINKKTKIIVVSRNAGGSKMTKHCQRGR